MKDQYDYIIVGAGSSGCALANRLSADPAYSVLLVESGPSDKNPFVMMPRGLGLLINPGSKHIWEYELHLGGNQKPERTFTGKALGGSSSVNGMVYMRGAPLDYDTWKAKGCEGWGWDDVGKKFVELENHDQGAAEWRGIGGPLTVTTYPKGKGIAEAILVAGEKIGTPRVADMNDVSAVRDGGLGYQTSTRLKGQRFSAARAFIKPIENRSNLEIALNTNVDKVVFEGKRASGILVRDETGTRTIRANREIILCAGALRTPPLLQRSGIGQADLLKSFGIETIVDSPEVGKNMRDHRLIAIRFRVKNPTDSHNRDLTGGRVLLSVMQYFLTHTGPMTHAAHEVGGFVKSDPSLDHADMQFGLMSVAAISAGSDGAVKLDPDGGVGLMVYFTRPESLGEVRIQSADPNAAPYINANYLAHETDRKKFVAGFRWLRKLSETSPLKECLGEETSPGTSVQTDDEILDKALSMAGSAFHYSGTARMGSDPQSVLDPQLRVRGVEGLRVADMSITPTQVSGNTNGAAMMIGLRAADFIIADRANAKTAQLAAE